MKKIAEQRASIEALVSGALPSGMTHEQFVEGVTITRIFIPPNPPRSTYDSLIANGDINLIEDSEVMPTLARYYADVASTQEYAARTSASNSGDYHPAILSIYDASVEGFRRQDADFSALAADPKFLEDSVDMLRGVAAVQAARRGLLENARETYATICKAARSICEDTSESAPSSKEAIE